MRNFQNLILIGGTGAAILLSGCSSSSSHGDRTEGRVLDDKQITAKIEDALKAAPVYKFDDVDVKTFDGVVQLSGFVTSQAQKQHAAEIAQGVKGVNRVVNGITLKPQAPTPTGRPDQSGQANPPEPTPATTTPPQGESKP